MKFGLLLALLTIACPVLAQTEPRITVDSGDASLVITDWLEEGNVFTGNLRLTTEGAAGKGLEKGADLNFTMLPSDLKSANGGLTVGRQHVALVGEPVLRLRVPKDFQIQVTGITQPATYQGKIELLPVGRPRADSVAVDLKVIARARPALKPLPSAEKLVLNLVNCQNSLSCALAGLLLPKSAFLDHWELQFDNSGAAEVTVADTTVAVLGEQAAYQLTRDQLVLPQGPQAFPARTISALPLTLKRTDMPPDHYTGNLYIMPEGALQRLAIPVDLHVRIGPLWPLLMILLGIILGRLFKYMQERGRPQTERLAAVNRMELDLRNAHAEDRQLLEPQLATVRQQVYRQDLETVTQQLNAIKARLETLTELRQIETRLKGMEQHPTAKEALGKIVLIRQRLAAREAVDDLLAELQRAVAELQRGGLMGADENTEMKQAAETARTAAASADRAGTAETAQAESKWRNQLKRRLIALAGLSDELRARGHPLAGAPAAVFCLATGVGSGGVEYPLREPGAELRRHPLCRLFGPVALGA